MGNGTMYGIVITNGIYFDARKSVERVQQNGVEGLEIIVADSFSDSRLQEWCGKSQIKYCELLFEEMCLGKALNQLIKENGISGDFLLIPAGVWLLPGCIETMVGILKEREDIACVSSEQVSNGSYQQALMFSDENKSNLWEIIYTIGFTVPILVRGEYFFAAEGFDEHFHTPDKILTDYYLNCISEGKFIVKATGAFSYIPKELTLPDAFVQMDMSDRVVLKDKWGSNYFCLYPNENLLSMLEETEKAVNVLEIGCDCGGNLLGVKNRCRNARLFGVDINARAAKIASGIADVVVADIEEKNLDFPVKFDYIIFADVLEHLRDPEGVLKYCRTLLNNGGKILACIPNLMNYRVMKELLSGYFSYQDEGLLDRTHIHFFTYYEIMLSAEKAGYEVENIMMRLDAGISQTDNAMIDNLLQLSNKAERFMYETFQYLVSLVPKK